MAPVEQWMREQESAAEALTAQLVAGGDVLLLMSNLFVIALVAAVSEEFFFRGALQRIIGLRVRNRHTAVWLTAFLFSAFHLQFYGFLPRMLLGVFLGYLLVWSGTVWLPVLAHFVNNALVLLFLSLWQANDSPSPLSRYLTGETDASLLLPSLFAALLSCLFLLPLLSLLKRRLHREHIPQPQPSHEAQDDFLP
jgi:membrane protease YdiL (CAAX protease family)